MPEMTPREYAQAEMEEALRLSAHYDGQFVAYRDMANRLDPTKHCQDCGKEYANPYDSDFHLIHESMCSARKARLNQKPTSA